MENIFNIIYTTIKYNIFLIQVYLLYFLLFFILVTIYLK